jgi:hypothetical protein
MAYVVTYVAVEYQMPLSQLLCLRTNYFNDVANIIIIIIIIMYFRAGSVATLATRTCQQPATVYTNTTWCSLAVNYSSRGSRRFAEVLKSDDQNIKRRTTKNFKMRNY